MKKLTVLTFLAVLLVGASASIAKASTFNWKDVRDMSEAGVPDDIIIQKINASDLVFELKGDQIIDLWEAGVSQKVITAMLKTETPDDEEQGEQILEDQKGDKDQADKGKSDDDNGYDNRSDAAPPSDYHSHVSIGLGFGFGYPLPYYSYYPYGYAYPYSVGFGYYPYASHYHYYPYSGYGGYGGYYGYGGRYYGGTGSYTRQRTVVGPSTKYFGYRSYGGGMVAAPRSGGFYRGGFSGGRAMMSAPRFGGFRTR